jgi:hypothetical protein
MKFLKIINDLNCHNNQRQKDLRDSLFLGQIVFQIHFNSNVLVPAKCPLL